MDEKKGPAIDKIVIDTGSSKYSFTQSWVENEGLKSVLVGLIADDLNRKLKSPDNEKSFF